MLVLCIKLIVILYKQELDFCKVTKSLILAKIKFSQTFLNLQYALNTGNLLSVLAQEYRQS